MCVRWFILKADSPSMELEATDLVCTTNGNGSCVHFIASPEFTAINNAFVSATCHK